MSAREGYKQAFGICSTNLKIMGLWPNKKTAKHEETISLFLFIISLSVIVIFVNSAQTTNLVIIWGDLIQMVDNLSTANLPIAMAVLKMFICRAHRKALGRLLSIVLDDWNDIKSKRAIENMHENAKLSQKISRLCVILGFGAVTGHLGVRIAQELNILPGPTEKRLPMLNSYFPYDIKLSPVYELTWLIQYIGAGLATLVYSGILCLFVGLVLHLRGQIANLKLELETLAHFNAKCMKTSGNQFKNQIGVIVERHENLNSFTAGINNVFSIMFLAEIFSCTIQICLQFFLLAILLSDNSQGLPIFQVLFMIIYAIHIGVHMFICCYASEKLREESSSFCQSLYNYQWYNLPSNDAKLLIIMMIRAEKPLTATAGNFFKFSLGLFAQILKTSAGYLSMLLAVKERLPSV